MIFSLNIRSQCYSVCFGKKHWLIGLRVQESEPVELLVYMFTINTSISLICCLYIGY